MVIVFHTTPNQGFNQLSLHIEVHVRHLQIRNVSQGVVCVHSVYLGSLPFYGRLTTLSIRNLFVLIIGQPVCKHGKVAHMAPSHAPYHVFEFHREQ